MVVQKGFDVGLVNTLLKNHVNSKNVRLMKSAIKCPANMPQGVGISALKLCP